MSRLIAMLLSCWSAFIIASEDSPSEEPDLSSITIVTGDYSPLIDKTMPYNGQVSKLVTDAFAEVDIKVNFVFVPWARAIRTVRLGKNVAVMYYGKTKDREKDFWFSDPIFRESWLLFHKQDLTLSWETLADLSKYRIGATLSYTYSEEFHELADNETLTVHWVSKDLQNWQMLVKDRIDIVIFPRIGWYQLVKLYGKEALSDFATDDKPLRSQLNYVLFSKKHPYGAYYQDKFNQGLTLLKLKSNLSDYLPLEEGKAWPLPDSKTEDLQN